MTLECNFAFILYLKHLSVIVGNVKMLLRVNKEFNFGIKLLGNRILTTVVNLIFNLMLETGSYFIIINCTDVL